MSNQNITELISIFRDENKKNDLRILSASVKMYDGNRSLRKIQYFIDEINWITTGFELTEEQKIVIAGRNMCMIAQTWYLAYKEEGLHREDTFQVFGERLKEQFGNKPDLQVLYSKLVSCKQRNSLESYNHQFYLITQEFPKDFMTEIIKTQIYLSNLKSQLRCEVKIREPTTLNDAMKYARILEDKFTGEENFTYQRNKFRQNRGFQNPNKYAENNDDTMYNIDIVKRRLKNKKCFVCNKEGHFAANCAKKSKN